MKKSFWGYNIQEVDANVGFLESQNVKLERQVKQLNAELEKVRKELEEASAKQSGISDIGNTSDSADVIAELQHKLADSEREKQELSAKIVSLSERLSELTVTGEPKQEAVFEDIGNIFRSAYSDMHITKQKTKSQLKKFIEQFWQKWNIYENMLTELSEQILTKQKESKENFISYADYVLQAYSDMENSNHEFDSRIAEIAERKNDIADELNGILAELDKDFDEEDKEDSEDYAADQVQTEDNDSQAVEIKYSILDTVRKMHEARIAQNKTQEADNQTSEKAAAGDKAAKPMPANNEEAPSISPYVNIRNII